MIKKTAVLVAALMLLSLASCGSSSSSSSEKQEAPAKAESSEKVENKAPEPEKAEEPKAEEPPAPEYKISNEVIVENESCAVTLVSVTAKKSGGADLKFQLENRTEDTTLTFSMDDTAVNGWILSSLFVESVAPGKKASETLSFSSSDLEECGLTAVDRLEFSMRIYDSDDWSAEEVVEDTFTVYPTGLTDAEIVVPPRPTSPDEVVIADDENLTFIILGAREDSIWGYTLDAYLENKTEDTTLMFSWDDTSVNGFMLDPFWACSVSPGNRHLSGISFSRSGFEENGITDVEEIEFELRVHDYDHWSADDFIKDVFTYEPAA